MSQHQANPVSSRRRSSFNETVLPSGGTKIMCPVVRRLSNNSCRENISNRDKSGSITHNSNESLHSMLPESEHTYTSYFTNTSEASDDNDFSFSGDDFDFDVNPVEDVPPVLRSPEKRQKKRRGSCTRRSFSRTNSDRSIDKSIDKKDSNKVHSLLSGGNETDDEDHEADRDLLMEASESVADTSTRSIDQIDIDQSFTTKGRRKSSLIRRPRTNETAGVRRRSYGTKNRQLANRSNEHPTSNEKISSPRRSKSMVQRVDEQTTSNDKIPSPRRSKSMYKRVDNPPSSGNFSSPRRSKSMCKPTTLSCEKEATVVTQR